MLGSVEHLLNKNSVGESLFESGAPLVHQSLLSLLAATDHSAQPLWEWFMFFHLFFF